MDKPEKRKRINIDKNTEVEIINNCLHRFIFDNPRMQQSIDLESQGDREFVSVADLRVMLNTSRKVLEGFDILICDVPDGSYELEDVLVFLGLDKVYDEYFDLSPEFKRGIVSGDDIKEFIIKSKADKFEIVLNKSNKNLKNKIIKTAVILFKLGEFGDYIKMNIIRNHTNEEIFNDAEETELDDELTII